MALPAVRSSQNPTTALATRRRRIMKKSGQCRTTPDRITATSIIHGIGPQKYERNFSNRLVFFSSISLGPYWVNRFCASACVRPSGDDSNFFSTSAKGSDFKSASALGFDPGLDWRALGWSELSFIVVTSRHRLTAAYQMHGLIKRSLSLVSGNPLRPK